jgi:hypothetical protein
MNTAANHLKTACVVSDDDQVRWDAAAQIRRDHPRWVVIWLARNGQFRARLLFRAPPGTVAIGTTAEELTARMDEIRQATSRPKRPARTRPTSSFTNP